MKENMCESALGSQEVLESYWFPPFPLFLCEACPLPKAFPSLPLQAPYLGSLTAFTAGPSPTPLPVPEATRRDVLIALLGKRWAMQGQNGFYSQSKRR